MILTPYSQHIPRARLSVGSQTPASETLLEAFMRRILALTLLSLALLGGATAFTVLDASSAIACDYHGS
jgi:hypothetical protein